MKKKLVAILLVAAMVLSLVACGDKKTSDGGSGSNASDSGSNDAGKKYTYFSTTGTINTLNPCDWQLNNENTCMSLCASSLYDWRIDFDSSTEWAYVPEMATALPEDVTTEYAGQYGIPADCTQGRAWKVTLRQDACWNDGTPITSADFIYSMQTILDPNAKAYRSNSYTDGQFALAGAKKYATGSFGEAVGRGKTMADVVKEADGTYTIDGHQVFFAWNAALSLLSGSGLKKYEQYVQPEIAEYFDSLVDGRGVMPLTEEVYNKLFEFTSSDAWGNETEEDLINYFYYDDPATAGSWEEVGFLAPDDYTIVWITCSALTEFYSVYGLDITLIKKDLFEANKTDAGGLTKSTYGTSVETYASYGPYYMDEYQEGKHIHFTRNEKWFGYTDGNHEGMYQTTDIDFQMIDEHTTILNLFLQGKLDDTSLTADDIPDYGTSEFTIYTPESYTATYAWNTDFDVLKSREEENVNKTIFTYIEWRKAFSLAIDRQAFCKTCTAGYQPAFGIVNNLYVYDPETMAAYRSSEPAKQTLCEVYDAANIDELTGYNVDEARQLLQAAYDKCYADGNIDDDDVVEVNYHIYGTDATYQRFVDFCEAAMLKAAEGTSLENRIKFNLVEDKDYYNSAKAGLCDLIRENWGGAAMNPFTMLECYCTDTSNEYGFDYMHYEATITVNGETKTQSVNAWYDELCNGIYSDADTEVRLQIMAGVEKALLLNYHIAPVAAFTSAGMVSQRIILPTDHWINQLIGWGSFARDYKYTMDDAEWEAYCKEQGNELSYK